MSKDWQDYQEEAATFFRSMGMTAEVEKNFKVHEQRTILM